MPIDRNNYGPIITLPDASSVPNGTTITVNSPNGTIQTSGQGSFITYRSAFVIDETRAEEILGEYNKLWAKSFSKYAAKWKQDKQIYPVLDLKEKEANCWTDEKKGVTIRLIDGYLIAETKESA